MQSNSELVSTIVPTFNRARLVVRAVASALAQTYQNHEVIVVDDGSSDETRSALETAFGNRIRYFYKENAGVSSARNYGLREASGDFLCFLDSDDVWHEQKLELQAACLHEHPDLGLVLTDIEWVDPDGRTTRIEHRRAWLPADGWLLSAALREPAFVPSTVMLRRAVYATVGPFDTTLKTAEDIDFYLRVAKEFQIGLIEKPLTRYMSGHASLSEPAAAFGDYAYVLERFVAENTDILDRAERRSVLFSTYERCARGLGWMDEPGKALPLLLKAAACARSRAEVLELGATTARVLFRQAKALANPRATVQRTTA